MTDDIEELKQQMQMALKAFADTFDTGFFVGTPVRRAAWIIQEMQGGKTVAERAAEENAAIEAANQRWKRS
jgi:hypothetical protein